MDIPLDEVLYFDCITTHPSTGAATDADSTPTFAVYEEATDADIGIGGNLTKRTSLTGNYRGTFTASAANGFEVGKWYSIIGSATVNAIAGKAVLRTFRIVLAESVAGEPKVDVGAFGGSAGTFSGGRAEVNTSHAAGTAWNSGAIGASTLASDTIAAAKIAAGAITNAKFAAGAIDAAAIADGAIDTATFASGTTIPRCTLTDTLTTYTGNTPQTGDSFAIVNSGTHGNAAIKGYVDDIGVAGAGLTAADDAILTAIAALNNLSASQVNAEVLDVLNVDALIDGKTIVQSLIYVGAICAGRASGAGTGTEVFKGLDESTTRVTVTVDGSGNRSDIVYG